MAEKLLMGASVLEPPAEMQIDLAKTLSGRADRRHEQNPHEVLQKQKQLQNAYREPHLQLLHYDKRAGA